MVQLHIRQGIFLRVSITTEYHNKVRVRVLTGGSPDQALVFSSSSQQGAEGSTGKSPATETCGFSHSTKRSPPSAQSQENKQKNNKAKTRHNLTTFFSLPEDSFPVPLLSSLQLCMIRTLLRSLTRLPSRGTLPVPLAPSAARHGALSINNIHTFVEISTHHLHQFTKSMHPTQLTSALPSLLKSLLLLVMVSLLLLLRLAEVVSFAHGGVVCPTPGRQM